MFVHLHAHDEFSFLDGLGRIEERVKRAKELGQKGLAQTNHGNLSGSYKFYKKALEYGIKPIIGVEFYVVDDLKKDSIKKHILILSKNYEGFKNLNILVTKSNLEGFYYKPRILVDWLFQYKEGLIVLTSCINSYFNDYDLKKFIKFKNEFGNDFYVELIPNENLKQKEYNKKLIEIAQKLNIKTIITNDVHYTFKEDSFYHEVLLCIGTKQKITEKHFKFEFKDLYLMSEEEIINACKKNLEGFNFDKSLKNVEEIYEKINLNLEQKVFIEYKIPKFSEDSKKKFQDLVKERFKKFIKEIPKDKISVYLEKLKREIKILSKLNLEDYFLIVYDFIKFARENDIAIGPGRGSVCGSLVAYILGITQIDPIKFDLIFERFINPQRKVLPDIDTDVQDDRREEVKQYLIKKYSEKNVCSVGTFSQLSPKALIRDLGRVFDLDYVIIDKVAKSLNDLPIEDQIEDNEILKKFSQKYPTIYKCLKRLQFQKRHLSIAAGGLVISDRNLNNFFSLRKRKNLTVSEIDREDLESANFLKIDILGLKTLTVIKKVFKELNKNLEFKDFKLDDKKVYEMFSLGKTDGIFQFESKGMRNLLKELKPRNFTDLTIANSLYRPGSIKKLEDLIKRHNGKEKIEFEFEEAKDILKDTYGIIVFQEQLLRVITKILEVDYSIADLLRRAFEKNDKKKIKEIMSVLDKNKIQSIKTRKLLKYIQENAGYLFNKSHATGYTLLAYISMFLKLYYPLIFYKNLLNTFIDDKDYIKDLILGNDFKIKFYPINLESEEKFKIYKDGILLPFTLIKGIGIKKAIQIKEKLKNNKKLNKSEKEPLEKLGILKSDDLFKKNKNKFEILKQQFKYLGFLILGFQNGIRKVQNLNLNQKGEFLCFVEKISKNQFFLHDSFFKILGISDSKINFNLSNDIYLCTVKRIKDNLVKILNFKIL